MITVDSGYWAHLAIGCILSAYVLPVSIQYDLLGPKNRTLHAFFSIITFRNNVHFLPATATGVCT